MSQTIILRSPTFDLKQYKILGQDIDLGILFCETTQVFKFDKCEGQIVQKPDIESSKYIKSVTSTIPVFYAGFCRKLMFKIIFTKKGIRLARAANQGGHYLDFIVKMNRYLEILKNSVQVNFAHYPVNQPFNPTDPEPDVIFSSNWSSTEN